MSRNNWIGSLFARSHRSAPYITSIGLMHAPRRALYLVACVWAGGVLLSSRVEASKWTVSPLNSLVLDTSNVSVSEMSGVTYLGPSPTAGKHRFLTVQDDGGLLITIDVEFNANGSLVSAEAVDDLLFSQSLDFEGVAYTDPSRNTVFLSYEDDPGVREYRLSDGVLEQSVTIPAVFANRRSNKGFESLARNPVGTVMWTANEEALTVDGSLATPSAGSPVRLLELNVAGNAVTAGDQYVYEVEPIHGSSTLGSPRSGLSDLLALPDGTLLGLERSVAVTSPIYLSRIYEIDFDGATDVSAAAFNSGLIGQTYTPVGKELLWAGAADGSSGQNLEGLALGPRLTNSNWALLGVVDDGDSLSSNTIVSFELSANPSADFDEDGDVDGFDFLTLQRNLGTVGPLATHANGDANGDDQINDADLAVWEAQYGSAPPLSAVSAAVPEPTTCTLALAALCLAMSRRRAF